MQQVPKLHKARSLVDKRITAKLFSEVTKICLLHITYSLNIETQAADLVSS